MTGIAIETEWFNYTISFDVTPSGHKDMCYFRNS